MIDDDAIRTLVVRLARPHRSGGDVIERAAILASGADSAAILAWIAARDARPEVLAPVVSGRSAGLHSARRGEARGSAAPSRYVLPPGALR